MKLDTSLRMRGRRLDLSLQVPDGAASGDFLVPVARELAGYAVRIAVEDVQAEGKEVSCRAGCGACCRQLVPISTFEARRLAALVDAMDEPRRTTVRARFAAAAAAMKAEGIDAAMADREARSHEHVADYAMRYFRMGIPCPLLEEESCSIYEERPVICREYLVTSPSERCADPTPVGIDRVPMPASPHHALMSVDEVSHHHPRLALVQALQWTQANPEKAPAVAATEQATVYFSNLVRRPLPPPGGMG